MVEGKGYTTIDEVKHEWGKGDLLYVSHLWWHQHLNLDLKKPAIYICMVSHGWAMRNLFSPLPYREHANSGPDPLSVVWPGDDEHVHDHSGHQYDWSCPAPAVLT